MKTIVPVLIAATFLAATAGLLAADSAEYHVVARYHVGGEGGYDYLRVDPAARRLYVSHNTKVDVLDVDSGKKVGEIDGLKRVHGIAIARDAGHGFVTSGGDNEIVMFDLRTLAVLKRTKATGNGPDAIEYDAGTKRIYVADHGSGDVTVVDPASGDVVGTVKFGEGRLEGIGFDGRGNGYVNAEDKSSVFVFDLKTLTPKAKWSSAPGEGGTGLAVDAAHHRVISACANGHLVVLDSDSGKVVATPAIDEDPDGVSFDPTTNRVFVPCVGGTLNIVQEQSPDQYATLQTVTTQRGCRTIALDEQTGRVVTLAPKYAANESGADEKGRRRRPAALPDTLEAIVIGLK